MPVAKSVAALATAFFILSLQPAFPQAAAKPILAYQVGAFVERGNADRLVAELFKRGFYGAIMRKKVGGKQYWCVTIEAPPNPFENFQDELLGAGYPSFPIR
jgi:hypothetical protein